MIAGVYSFFILFITAALVTFELYSTQVIYLLGAAVVCGLAAAFLKKRYPAFLKAVTLSLSVLWGSALLFYLIMYSVTFMSSSYGGAENKNGYFAGHNVMIMVPHEDDEVNLMGGVIEKYLDAGSIVRVVYATNGDRWAEGSTRINESVEAMRRTGIPEENLIFLGYGDMWSGQTYPDGSYSGHIYNAKDDAVWTSLKNQGTGFRKYTETYGTKKHPPYRTHGYTRENYLKDIHDVILEYRPDVIYVNDFDDHADHRGLSLFFEEAMGMILKENGDYRPRVCKGFCYATAWDAPDDYDASDNVLSTRKPEDGFSLYDWDERLRLPVRCSALGHTLKSAGLFRTLSAFVSQNGEEAAYRVINGDRAFWERRTDSLLYNAGISMGGKELSMLNDFKLLDSDDVIERDRISAGTVEVRSGSRVAVLLKEPADIYELALSGDPDPANNILEGHIEWEDGSVTPFGPLKERGGQVFITCNREKVNAFSVITDSVTGAGAGLTEIEAFGEYCALNEPGFIKLMDERGHFLYDVTVAEGEETESLLAYGAGGGQEYELTGDGGCSMEEDRERGSAVVTVPRGRKCQVTVREGELSDTVRISNPGAFTRRWRDLVCRADRFLIKGKGFLNGRFRYYRKVMRAVIVKLDRG